MQVASRQALWSETGRGTVVDVAMTPETGLYFKLAYYGTEGSPLSVSWGDGTATRRAFAADRQYVDHRYARHGRYRIVVEGVKCVALRFLDGEPQYAYDAAVVSVVDFCGQITGSSSAAFKRAVNLERYIAPNCRWQGQRDFAYCSKLKEIVIGRNTICYDGTYQFCTSLEKYKTESTGRCWSYVWQGCTKLRELRLGAVSQFATEDFRDCPNLTDIWISDKTVEQIKQVAPSGNIIAGYGAKFPWSANAGCRFHGTNGIVLGDGTIIHE